MLWRCSLLMVVFVCAHAAVPKELQALVDEARALPPEFRADLLLRSATSPDVQDPAWERAIIEDAFLSGAQAPAPLPLRGALSDFDGLTLQLRAVYAMMALSPAVARSMFAAIPALHLP